ncbi:MAG: hypothetical protein ACREYE_08590, partial [Gammaproteobacteria bacterium]
PAGQIAVLSRTVLARILRLDRRTGISAKEDLTAPPQTCRKDTNNWRRVLVWSFIITRIGRTKALVRQEKVLKELKSNRGRPRGLASRRPRALAR